MDLTMAVIFIGVKFLFPGGTSWQGDPVLFVWTAMVVSLKWTYTWRESPSSNFMYVIWTFLYHYIRSQGKKLWPNPRIPGQWIRYCVFMVPINNCHSSEIYCRTFNHNITCYKHEKKKKICYSKCLKKSSNFTPLDHWLLWLNGFP